MNGARCMQNAGMELIEFGSCRRALVGDIVVERTKCMVEWIPFAKVTVPE